MINGPDGKHLPIEDTIAKDSSSGVKDCTAMNNKVIYSINSSIV